MRQWIGSTLVQTLACRLFDTKPLSEPMLNGGVLSIGQIRNKFQWNFNQNTVFFSHSRRCTWKYRQRNGGHFVQGGDELNLSTWTWWIKTFSQITETIMSFWRQFHDRLAGLHRKLSLQLPVMSFFDEIFVNGCPGSCHYNFWWNRWLKFRRDDGITVLLISYWKCVVRFVYSFIAQQIYNVMITLRRNFGVTGALIIKDQHMFKDHVIDICGLNFVPSVVNHICLLDSEVECGGL